jgi:N-acetylmuramoyl-L-alanine amidase
VNSRLLPKRELVAATLFLATLASLATVASQPAALLVNGEAVVADVPPVTVAREAYVPLRAVADRLGADTSYNKKTGTLEVTRGDDTLRLRLNDRAATFNGNPLTLGHAPFVVRGRTMVAVGAIAKAFGSKVSYDRARRRISVTSEGTVEAGAQVTSP